MCIVYGMCTCVCVRGQFAAALAREFKKGLSEEVACNLISSREPCKDMGKGN